MPESRKYDFRLECPILNLQIFEYLRDWTDENCFRELYHTDMLTK